MMTKLSVLVLLCTLVNISNSSEEIYFQRNQNTLINSKMLNKKILPNVKHLLKDNKESDRQKFLRILDGIDVDDYTISDGEY